ncbi:uncharacterized protein LOC128769899 isoform X2 [Synchiropus splendidus]|uniref:uncharacterized protein LOC128769899 isoform X2 n=1 Tax=Synchiropus splendidus TaxID=270530 RepID=UPI00237D6320|nr:uncharacterized protein LOC128769899 isoform X2 [Synchiropus splendidus]
MEERAVQQAKMESLREGGQDGGKTDWKNDCSLSSLLKHSCLLCWRSPRDTDLVETDQRVIAKSTEIRELENAVTVENLELQEQQSDRQELEETLVKLDKHKEKLLQQIKTTRQLCYEESQKILSLQAEEVQKESQVEEYERELARARWRLRKLREEVKLAKRKLEEAGERNSPLQDSIRQSYEEILQEENTLYSLSGGAVTPESQLDDSMSPADTTEDEPLPIRPWGRSQSLPAYADLIMGANGAPFCNSLADTREEADDSGSSSSKMDRSEDGDIEQVKMAEGEEFPDRQLDFYQADPFVHCQSNHELFNQDLFLKTDSSDGFASDPFKGSNPFAADVLFPDEKAGSDDGTGNVFDEADTSLSCAENKASTGTQCFESEFPDEDSDIEISYSQENLDIIMGSDNSCGFKPIQSSSEDLGPEPVHGWKSQGQFSVESDPNGYELDLSAVSPPSDIEEHSLGSIAGELRAEPSGDHQGEAKSETTPSEKEHTANREEIPSLEVTCGQGGEWDCYMERKPEDQLLPVLQDHQVLSIKTEKTDLSFELSYEQCSQSSYDPYGFKLSPEHSNNTLLDPDEHELSPEPLDNDLSYDNDDQAGQSTHLDFDPYGFDIASAQIIQESDPYGFKLSPEDENQEVPELCDSANYESLDLSGFKNKEQVESFEYTNQEVLDPLENPEHCDNNQNISVQFCDSERSEVLVNISANSRELELLCDENQEIVDHCSPDNQEVVEPFSFRHEYKEETSNQELLKPYSSRDLDLLDFCPDNQEVPDLDTNQVPLNLVAKENQEVLDSCTYDNQEVLHDIGDEDLDPGCHDNQEVLDRYSKEVFPEKNNNNQCVLENECAVINSSDSDSATEDLLGLERSNTHTCIAPNTTKSFTKDPTSAPAPAGLLEGDLSSVFGAGGYIGCPDVADDLEPLDHREVKPVPEPVRPVRPPRPSLRAKEKAKFQNQGIDLK